MDDDKRLTGDQTARWLGVTTATLRRWRRQGTGPKGHRAAFGRCRIWYRASDVRAWAEEHGAELSADPPPRPKATPQEILRLL